MLDVADLLDHAQSEQNILIEKFDPNLPGIAVGLAPGDTAGRLERRHRERNPHNDIAAHWRRLRVQKAQTATTDIAQRFLLVWLILKPDLDGDIRGMANEAAHGCLRLGACF